MRTEREVIRRLKYCMRQNKISSDRDINLDNYFISTIATFKGCKVPNRKPDYHSGSNSKYWYGKNSKGIYIIRLSNHWSFKKTGNIKRRGCSNVGTCYWGLVTNDKKNWTLAGKCYISSFKSI